MSQRLKATDMLEHLDAARERRKRWVGVYIGGLAGLLAICNVGADNAAKVAVQANLEATDSWSFFQAKNIRRAVYTLAAEQMDVVLETKPELPAAARQRIAERATSYRAVVRDYTRSQPNHEGLDDLFAKAKAYEARRDTALRRDPYFDLSQALLQIAVVLASVHLIVGNSWLLRVSETLAALGVVIMANGLLLLFRLPLLG